MAWATGFFLPVTISVASALCVLGLRWARRRRSPARPGPLPAPRTSAVPALWEAAGDFAEGGWCRADFDTLRLLCLNLEPGQPFGARLAERFRRAASAVLGPGIHRLEEVAEAARLLDLPEPEILRIEQATLCILQELASAAFGVADRAMFDPPRVVEAIGAALEGCRGLRTALAPQIEADALGVLRGVVSRHHARLAQRGDLILDVAAAVELPPVLVRDEDLSSALAQFIEGVFTANRIVPPVRVTAADDTGALRLRVAWTVVDRTHFNPAGHLHRLRALSAYRVRLALDEVPEESRIELSAWLPLARPSAGRQAV